MRKRLFGLLASSAIVFAACGGTTASPSPTGAAPQSPAAQSPAAQSPAAESPGASAGESPAGSPGAENIDDLLFGSSYSPEQGTPGGSVIIADWQAADQLNYYYSNAFKNSQVMAATMRGLWTISNDARWVPDLGVNVPRLSDGSVTLDDSGGGFTVNLDIKPGLKWSDGETLDLNDLRYTWEWILDPDNTGLPSGTTGWDLIDRFDVAGDGLSAEVHFKSGFAGWMGTLASPMLPEHYMSEIQIAEAPAQSYPVAPSTVDAPVSGPYKYASLSPTTIELERNPNWAAGVSTQHEPYLERVVYQFYADKGAMVAGFLAGEIDVATDLLQGDYASISGVDPSVGTATIDAAWEYEHFDMNQLGAGPGKGHPALQDPKVRQAIAMNIDKTALYETVYPGTPLPDAEPCSPVPPGLYWRSEEGLTCIEFNRDEANRLLDEAGWTDTNNDGTRDKDGVELDLLHCHTGAAFRQSAGDFLASEMREIGVGIQNTAEATIFDGWNDVEPDQICNLARGNYDTTEFAWVNTFDLFGNFYYSYHSSQIPTEENDGNGANYVRLNEPEMDEALDELFEAVDPAEARDLAVTIQQIHTRLQPEVVLYYRSGVRGLNPNLKNFARNPGTASDMWNIEDWYLQQ